MHPSQLEARVLQIASLVRDKAKLEDSSVELKAEWPADPTKFARQLAGMCNSLHGLDALIVIGLCEKRGAIGCVPQEMASFWPQVQREFDGVAPDQLLNLVIPFEGKTLHALLFSTQRVPFVVRSAAAKGGAGPIDREVPWRDGNRTRTATREDLVRLLAPLQETPSLEWIEGTAEYGLGTLDPIQGTRLPDRRRLNLTVKVYLATSSASRVVYPLHKCPVNCYALGLCMRQTTDRLRISTTEEHRIAMYQPAFPSDKSSGQMIYTTPYEIVVNGPGMLRFEITIKLDNDLEPVPSGSLPIRFDMLLTEAGGNIQSRLVGDFPCKCLHHLAAAQVSST